jgi:hypothetical protein
MRCRGTALTNTSYPSEKHGFLVFRIIQPSTFESFCCLDHEKASPILSTECVVVETLFINKLHQLNLVLLCEGEKRGRLTHARGEVFNGVLRHRVRLELRKQESMNGGIWMQLLMSDWARCVECKACQSSFCLLYSHSMDCIAPMGREAFAIEGTCMSDDMAR